ncbi:MAG: glycoside hydrolase family 30 beta sandwich domain-containing protein, partial [Pseudomonadales bacterium]
SATRNPEGLLSVQLLNTQEIPITLSLEIGDQAAEVLLPANALQTVRVRLNNTAQGTQ